MDTTSPHPLPPGSIVIGIDGSVGSADALRWATEQARLERRPLGLLHVVDDRITTWGEQPGAEVDEMLAAMDAQGQRHLDDAVAALESAPEDDLVVHPVLVRGDPREVLVEASTHAACLVLGSRGRGPVASLVLGSVSVGVIRRASCPVVVLRPAEPTETPHPKTSHPSVEHVVVGLDRGRPVGASVEFAFRHAALRRLPLLVLHPPEADQEATALLVQGLREKFPDVDVTYVVARGFAEAYLLGAAHDGDLVVIGTRHPSWATVVAEGNVARFVTEHAHCPVAVVPEV